MDHGRHAKWALDQDISDIAVSMDMQLAINEMVQGIQYTTSQC